MTDMAEPENLNWRKSSFSAGAENCVEVAEAANGGRWVRDTKDRGRAAHHFTAAEWEAFLGAVKDRRFERERLHTPSVDFA
jgi:hypothetical protein